MVQIVQNVTPEEKQEYLDMSPFPFYIYNAFILPLKDCTPKCYDVLTLSAIADLLLIFSRLAYLGIFICFELELENIVSSVAKHYHRTLKIGIAPQNLGHVSIAFCHRFIFSCITYHTMWPPGLALWLPHAQPLLTLHILLSHYSLTGEWRVTLLPSTVSSTRKSPALWALYT